MYQTQSKRIIDITVSAILLVVAAPMIVALAIVSAASLRCWPFFVQDRVGLGGETFRFVKIRTLPKSFAAYAPKPALDFARVPLPMRFLRATHLDELPQLVLVLVGRMSLVGPRPEMPMLHATLAPAVAAERVSVRPGLTGMWQVSPHCDGLISDRVEYDRLYVRFASTGLDLWIMVKTAEKMLLGRRVHLFDIPHRVIGSERAVIDHQPVVIDLSTRPRRRALSFSERLPFPVGTD